MLTFAGVITALVCIICLLSEDTWLYPVLICSALFQSSSAINLGHLGIQPFFVIAAFFVLSQMRKGDFWTQRFRVKYLFLAFGVLGFSSAFLYPFLFEGTRVYNPHLGIDTGYLNRWSLQFGLANWAQAVYLALDVLVVLAATSLGEKKSGRQAFNAGFFMLTALVMMQSLCMVLGMAFPYEILQTNPGYAMSGISSGRAMGTFAEPSMAGLALIVYYACFYFEFIKHGRSLLRLLLCAISIVLVRSSAALLSVLIVSAMLFLYTAVARLRTRIQLSTLLRSMAVPLATAALIATPPVRSLFQEHVLDKSDTRSFFYRTAADITALEITRDTYGVGVGLGSNRPSSLLCALLSTIGIPGTALFATLAWRVGSAPDPHFAWARWSLFGGLIDAILCVPDVTMPMIWVVFALAAQGMASHRAKDPKIPLPVVPEAGAIS